MGRYDDQGGAGPRKRRGGAAVRRAGGRPHGSRGGKVLGWIAAIVVVVLVTGSLAAYWKYRSVWNSIGKVAVTDLGKRPPKYTNAENLLVFGSDSRAGLSFHDQVLLHVGPDGCGCSDTIMVVHIEPGHHGVTVLNLPRDTMVPVYQCDAGTGEPGQTAQPGAEVQINETLQHGGPACLWKTVEQATGIRLDHFIQLSFNGVVKVINDIGGVNVCVPFNINDPNSGLRITRGERHITGLKFLEFWRARYSLADGTDLKRIQRDDLLLAQVFRDILHEGLLSSPTRMLSVITDAAKSMDVDNGMTQTDMLQLAENLRGLSDKDLQFIEAPTMQYPPAPAQVEFIPQDTHLFYAIAHNTSVSRASARAAKAAKAKAKTGSGGTPVLDASPSKVKVEVLNGSGVSQVAAHVAAGLTARGFDVVGTGDAATFGYTGSVIEYAAAADLPAVHTLRAQLGHVTVLRDPSLTPGTLQLIVGSTFTALKPASSSSSGSGASVAGLAKSYGGITGTATCRSDKSAFAGPNSP